MTPEMSEDTVVLRRRLLSPVHGEAVKKTETQRRPSVCGSIWNHLPLTLKNESVDCFKKLFRMNFVL